MRSVGGKKVKIKGNHCPNHVTSKPWTEDQNSTGASFCHSFVGSDVCVCCRYANTFSFVSTHLCILVFSSSLQPAERVEGWAGGRAGGGAFLFIDWLSSPPASGEKQRRRTPGFYIHRCLNSLVCFRCDVSISCLKVTLILCVCWGLWVG